QCPTATGIQQPHDLPTGSHSIHTAPVNLPGPATLHLLPYEVFPVISHKILLLVLTDLGIIGTAWKWFESYLEDRHYQVTWNGSTSAPCPLETDPIEDELERAWPPFNSSVDIQRENRRSCGLFVSVRGDVAGELELDNTD
ncbi:hypothetical protein NFI96_019715, partial [Prochilodus magdalenae]